MSSLEKSNSDLHADDIPHPEDSHAYVEPSLQSKSARDWSCLGVVDTDKSFKDWNEDDLIGLKFDSLESVEHFYATYSYAMGFGIRRHDKKEKKGIVTYRRWVCSKQGFREKKHLQREDRKREHRALTRSGCEASIRVKFDKKCGKYKVAGFHPFHNHDVVSLNEVQFVRSHRSVGDADGYQVKSMRDVGIKTSQIMDFMVNQGGGYQNVGFTTKDLYNFVDFKNRCQIIDSDAQTALSYLIAKFDMDPDFYCRYAQDNENRLRHLFWADSKSRLDYECFGDVLLFDTTYKTNAYEMPFVILVGVNNHGSTTVFGCALLADETENTYVWVLKQFLDAMGNKMPQCVMTDGDRQMRRAIERLMPDAKHRLCSWHLGNNASANVHDRRFVGLFDKFLLKIKSVTEFELQWKEMVDELGLHDNEWVSKMYDERERWAQAFCQDHFMAGMTSTQRCEGMHSYLNRFLKCRLKLFEFVRQFDRGVRRLRQRELELDFKSHNTEPVLTTHLGSIEKHAADVYTRDIFFEVRNEILKESVLNVTVNARSDGSRIYTLSEFGKPNSRSFVVFHPNDTVMSCSCKKFENRGLPCCHLFAVMKAENLLIIPPSLMMTRWTKQAREYPQTTPQSAQRNLEIDEMIRRGSLNMFCDQLSYHASKTYEGYQETKKEIWRLISRVKGSLKEGTQAPNEYVGRGKGFVNDPKVAKTKGSKGPSTTEVPKKRRCSHCRNVGHSIRKCPQQIRPTDPVIDPSTSGFDNNSLRMEESTSVAGYGSSVGPMSHLLSLVGGSTMVSASATSNFSQSSQGYNSTDDY